MIRILLIGAIFALILAGLRPPLQYAGLLMAAVTTGGLVLGRITSLLLEGASRPIIWAYLATELAGLAASLALLAPGG